MSMRDKPISFRRFDELTLYEVSHISEEIVKKCIGYSCQKRVARIEERWKKKTLKQIMWVGVFVG